MKSLLAGVASLALLAIAGCDMVGEPQQSASDVELHRVRHHALKVPVMVEYAESLASVQEAGGVTQCQRHLPILRSAIVSSYREVSQLPSSWQQRRVQTIYSVMTLCVPDSCASDVNLNRCADALADLTYLFGEDPRFDQGDV
jgi:hypothetical protein